MHSVGRPTAVKLSGELPTPDLRGDTVSGGGLVADTALQAASGFAGIRGNGDEIRSISGSLGTETVVAGVATRSPSWRLDSR